ncbi:MAG: hypothetical protein JWQ87_210 [Candidatus Sulfotelmatobacter sp.]|nr:hypothetical protein [Candidatus Sulfotelmatobacter sp.]
MKFKVLLYFFSLFMLMSTAPVVGQNRAAAASDPQYVTQTSVAAGTSPQSPAVSYASVSQVNGLLSQLEATSKTAQNDLTRLRIERWKTDGSTKKQTLGNVDSIQRNLQSALPEIMGQVRNAPEDLSASFKLYRNLDALYDVLGNVAESAGAFGPKDDFQSLSNDLNSFEVSRRQLADRLANLATSKEQELSHLRTELKTAQAAVAAVPPKKTVIDDNQPAKKPAAKKKPATKKPATTPGQTPPEQQAKPQS